MHVCILCGRAGSTALAGETSKVPGDQRGPSELARVPTHREPVEPAKQSGTACPLPEAAAEVWTYLFSNDGPTHSHPCQPPPARQRGPP